MLIPDPEGVRYQPEGLVRGSFSFRIARSAFGFPARIPTPFGGWYRTPKGSGNKIPKGFYYVTNHPRRGCDNETFNAHTHMSCNFGLFEPVSGLILRQGFGQNCGQNCSFFSLTGSLRGRFNPRWGLNVTCSPLRVIPTPPGVGKKTTTLFWSKVSPDPYFRVIKGVRNLFLVAFSVIEVQIYLVF